MKREFVFYLDKDEVTASKMKSLYRATLQKYPIFLGSEGAPHGVPPMLEIEIEPRELDTICRFIGISQVAIYRAMVRTSGTVETETVTRAQFNDTLRAIKALLEMRQVSAAQRVIASALHEPYKLGSPQLTSALKTLKKPMSRVTRRSKRSA